MKTLIKIFKKKKINNLIPSIVTRRFAAKPPTVILLLFIARSYSVSPLLFQIISSSGVKAPQTTRKHSSPLNAHSLVSCTPKNKIILNPGLLKAPPVCIEYVSYTNYATWFIETIPPIYGNIELSQKFMLGLGEEIQILLRMTMIFG
jgi:hypothetical protein